MAVTPGYVNSATITWAASTTATVTSQSIGTASPDRVVVVAVSIEADFDISSCTIGGVAATAGPNLRNTAATPDIACAFFYRAVPTGTTADIGVTLSGSSSSIGRISTWAMTGAMLPHADSNTNSGTGTSITLGSVTVPTNGAGFWAWANATNTATAWTNASERDDAGAGTSGTAYRHSVADTTTAGTATITSDGANAQQTIIGMSFGEAPPLGGWDLAPPQNVKATQSVNPAAMLMAASGLILAPYPYVQEVVPDFTHASTTSGYAFTRNLYYQAKIAPPPIEPVFVAPTTMDWQQPLSKVPPSTRPTRSQAIFAFPPPPPQFSLFDVSSTYLAVKVLHYQDKFEAIAVVEADNTVTPDKWLQAWKGPPRPLLELPGGQPFIPAEATRENTVTPDKWLQAWKGPPSYQPIPVQTPPFVPKEAVLENTVTPDKWLQAWKGPPSYQPNLGFSTPFVPKEAVLENTVTPDKWMRPFTTAVPALRLNISQVTYATPPAVESNLTTTLEWLRPWQGPPSYQPPAIAAQPFVPREAVLENTVTPDKWLFRWAKAVPVPKPVPTQPVFGYPYVSQAIVVPYEQWWHQPLSQAVDRPQVHNKPYSPFVPKEAVRENTQTPDKWLQAWKAPPAYRPIKVQTPQFVPKAAIVDLQTPDKWLRPLADAAARPPVWPTQPTWLPAPPTAEAEDFSVFSIETVYVSRQTLFYESTFVPSYPYLTEPGDAGPADEHERIACVPLVSRVAIVPELARVVEVPLSDREQDSNEYRDRSCGTPETPVVTEPEVPTEESPFQEDAFQHEDDAFQ